LVKIKEEEKMDKERDPDQDKTDGDVMIDGPEGLLHFKDDHHLVTVEIKTFKHLYLNAKEIKCNF
jgi:hypothetical protein